MQHQRYFVAAVGFATAVVWTAEGMAAALTCLAVAGLGYAVTGLAQRGSLGRLAAAARSLEAARARSEPARAGAKRRSARTGPPARRQRPVASAAPVAPVVREPSLEATTYGW